MPGTRLLDVYGTKRGVVQPAYLAERPILLVAGHSRSRTGKDQAHRRRRHELERRRRMGTALSAPRQRQHRLQRDGQHRDGTLHAQRKDPLARRAQHGQRPRRLLGTKQGVGTPPPRNTASLHRRRLEQGRHSHLPKLQQHRALRGHGRTPIPLRLLHHHGRTPRGHGHRRKQHPRLPPRTLARLGLRQGQLRHGRRRALRTQHLRLLPGQRDGRALRGLAARQAKPANQLHPLARG